MTNCCERPLKAWPIIRTWNAIALRKISAAVDDLGILSFSFFLFFIQISSAKVQATQSSKLEGSR